MSILAAPPVCTVPEFRTRNGKVEALIVASEVSPWLLDSRAPPYPNWAAPGMVSKAWALAKVGVPVWKKIKVTSLTLLWEPCLQVFALTYLYHSYFLLPYIHSTLQDYIKYMVKIEARMEWVNFSIFLLYSDFTGPYLTLQWTIITEQIWAWNFNI